MKQNGKQSQQIRKSENPILMNDSAVLALFSLKKGQAGIVANINTINEKKIHKMISIGIMPGLEISLKQRQPSIVFKAGYSEFAIDDELAKDIYVKIIQ